MFDQEKDLETLKELGLDHYFHYVVLSPEEIPENTRQILYRHGCAIAVASVKEIQAANSAGYPHCTGWIICPPGTNHHPWV